MRILAGTSGYSYKEWLGHFYPEKLPANAMLRYYGERFATVEINNTFYRMPAEDMLARWSSEVPRRITHDMRLRDTQSTVEAFVGRAAALGDKLGVLLFQIPPFLKKDLPRLRDFLDVLPPGTRAAFEFRNDSWQNDEVYDALRTRGAMVCATDTEEGDTPFVVTAQCGYVRLRRTHYDERDLAAWAERIAAQPLDCTYVYFMHEDEALGCRFAEMLNTVTRNLYQKPRPPSGEGTG
jgi:uncharacterized protein YecE (DUF72 family)